MRYTIIGAWIGLAASVTFAQQAASGPAQTAPASSAADASAVEKDLILQSLDHSAQSLVHSPTGTPGRAGRLVTLVRYIYRQNPADPQAQALMSDIYEIQNDLKSASELAAKRLAADPENYGLGLAYLRLSLAAQSTAKARLDFLASAATNNKLTPSIRAEACTQAANILLNQDDRKAAGEKIQQALKLDPTLPSALAVSIVIKPNAKPLEQVNDLLALIKASPTDTDASWELALRLDDVGLYERSVLFFNYGWELVNRVDPNSLTEPMAVQYCNGLLDAGQATKVIETLVPLQKKLGDTPEIKSLLIEAYRTNGNNDKAGRLLEDMRAQLGDQESLANKSPQAYKQTAWYFLINDYRPNSALAYARTAAKSPDEKGEDMALVLSAAELQTGDVAAGEAGLKKLLDKDTYAAWFLARYYFANNRAEDGKKAVLAGAKISRRGRASRNLAAIAKRQNITIDLPAEAKDISAAVGSFDARYLAMGESPERFVSVKIVPKQEEVTATEPLEVEAVLTNESELDVPTGPSGLFNPAMSLRTGLENGQDFDSLPMAIWPAKRFLKAGESLRTTVRMDVGNFQQWIFRHPLDNMPALTVGTLDPVQKEGKSVSSLPTLAVQPGQFKIGDVMIPFDPQKDDWEKAYQLTLGYMVKDIRQGNIRERMAAARKLGALLTLVNDVELARGQLPRPLMGKVKQPVLLSMLRAVMQDSSPAVRAEMASSLVYCRLNPRLLGLLVPAQDDSSELVRLRMAELLGVSGEFKDKQLAAKFAADRDETVRRMAAVFTEKKP